MKDLLNYNNINFILNFKFERIIVSTKYYNIDFIIYFKLV